MREPMWNKIIAVYGTFVEFDFVLFDIDFFIIWTIMNNWAHHKLERIQDYTL